MAATYTTSLAEHKAGAFVRTDSVFRDRVSTDGSTAFPAASGRYALYVSYACPWAARCLAFRAYKGLQAAIQLVVVEPVWDTVDEATGAAGWVFHRPDLSTAHHLDGANEDYLNHTRSMRELYQLASPGHTGKCTVPVLWDIETKKIVNNESSEIIQILDSAFNAFAAHPERTLRPAELLEDITAQGDRMYNTINNGVYRCGFAKAQEPYDEAYDLLFTTLDYYEDLLSKQRFVCGSTFTEADVRLFVTIVRFDPVYVCYFKTNRNRIADMPNLREWMCDVFQQPDIEPTVRMDHIKCHYFMSHRQLNPFQIVPKGPKLVDLHAPHERATKFAKKD